MPINTEGRGDGRPRQNAAAPFAMTIQHEDGAHAYEFPFDLPDHRTLPHGAKAG